MKKFLYLAMALCVGFAMTSCDDDDDVKTAILSFEGDEWTALIDNAQYGGTLIYSADEYKWTDSKTGLSSECTKDDWTMWGYGYGWKNGIAISNYIDSDIENHADYHYQLSVPKSNGSKNFAVVWDNESKLTFADGKARVIKSMQVMNTTYAMGYLKNNMAEGYKFVVKATGMMKETETGSIDIVLAENTTAIENWKRIDLSKLGAVTSVAFTFESTESGTPKYFAFDDVVVEME